MAISHPVAAELNSWFGVPLGRIVVVPNPATAKVAEFAGFSREASDQLRIAVPGRLVDQKRPRVAVEVAAELNRRGHAVEVEFFGSGPLESALAAEAAALGVSVHLHGWVEDWCQAVAPGSVVLLCSDREGFGNVLVEAAAVGLPSVAWSNALGVADAIVCGVTGELAARDSASSFADAVERARSLLPLDVPAAWLSRFGPAVSTGMLLDSVAGVIDVRKS